MKTKILEMLIAAVDRLNRILDNVLTNLKLYLASKKSYYLDLPWLTDLYIELRRIKYGFYSRKDMKPGDIIDFHDFSESDGLPRFEKVTEQMLNDIDKGELGLPIGDLIPNPSHLKKLKKKHEV
jgi:hypothetical protein